MIYWASSITGCVPSIEWRYNIISDRLRHLAYEIAQLVFWRYTRTQATPVELEVGKKASRSCMLNQRALNEAAISTSLESNWRIQECVKSPPAEKLVLYFTLLCIQVRVYCTPNVTFIFGALAKKSYFEADLHRKRSSTAAPALTK